MKSENAQKIKKNENMNRERNIKTGNEIIRASSKKKVTQKEKW